MTDIQRLKAGQVIAVKITDTPRSSSVSGYGAKLPTRYMLTLKDGITRRVYVVCYGNSGSTYVLIRGVRHYLSTWSEYLIDTVSNGGTIAEAITQIKGYPAWMSEDEGLCL